VGHLGKNEASISEALIQSLMKEYPSLQRRYGYTGSDWRRTMTINLSHQRNPLIAWDINVSVTAGKREKIANVLVEVGGIRVLDENVIPHLALGKRR
jgi:hypothetical protein